jgi:hypothetical protein
MRSASSSALRIGAVVFAIALGGAYVWFRAAQAGEGRPRVLPGSKSLKVDVSPSTQPAGDVAAATGPSTAPATLPHSLMFYTSKSAQVDVPGTFRISDNGIAPGTQPSATVAPAQTPSTAPSQSAH